MTRAFFATTALAVALAACGTPRTVATPAAPDAAAAPAAAPAPTTAATPAPAPAPAAAPAAAGTASLQVELVAPSDRGVLRVALFSSPDTFLREPTQSTAATPVGGKATVVFEGLAPGRHAVVVYQDTDGDGELGMGGMGPTEPWGFSGDRGGMLMGPPQWLTASQEVGAGGATITVNVNH